MILDIQRKLDQSVSSIQSMLVSSVSPDDGIVEQKWDGNEWGQSNIKWRQSCRRGMFHIFQSIY